MQMVDYASHKDTLDTVENERVRPRQGQNFRLPVVRVQSSIFRVAQSGVCCCGRE